MPDNTIYFVYQIAILKTLKYRGYLIYIKNKWYLTTIVNNSLIMFSISVFQGCFNHQNTPKKFLVQ